MERLSLAIFIFVCIVVFGDATTVTYDSKALVIDGQRRLLLSGSLHYPRATPEVWPDLIRKCKEGGLDVIETYVFWNNHEPERGQYYFEGRFDLVRFVKAVQEAGLYVHLRIGPYACAEWNYGGFPMWLHFIPGIQFRTTNTPYKNEMERFLGKIVSLMKEENLFATQGGPIILAQVENEYGNVEWAYGVGGELYVKWAASTALALNTTVPWVMCSQEDAPNPIVVSQKTPVGSLRKHKVTEEYYLTSSDWEWYKEQVGILTNNSFTRPGLLEQINTTRDRSDYLWYTISINLDEELSPNEQKEVFLHIQSLGHAAVLFINKELAGFGYGNHDDASFSIDKKITLNQGNNSLEILSMMIGLQNYGPWFDIVPAGIFLVTIADLASAERDFSSEEWTYQVGTEGEYLGLDKMDHVNSSFWASGNVLPANQSLIWYKTSFVVPEGNGPLALNLSSMGKGQAWVNGQSIGRYWSAYLAPSTGCTDNCDYRGPYDSNKCLKNCGEPAQTLYHIPRSWVYPGKNLLVLHEELGGDPSKITVSTRTGQELCVHISESAPPVYSWKLDSIVESLSPEVQLSCERGWHIASVSFASFGTPQGACGKFSHGSCSADVLSVVQEACLGRESCSVVVSADKFGDPCPGVVKSLAVEAFCSE